MTVKPNQENKTYLADVLKEKDMTVSEVARLTRDAPEGYGTMSKQTVASHSKGTSNFDLYPHAVEYRRILEVPLYRLLNPNYPCTDIVYYYDREDFTLRRNSIEKPQEVVYFMNWESINPTWKAIFYPTFLASHETIDIVDIAHRPLCETKDGRSQLFHRPVFLKRAKSEEAYHGFVLEFKDVEKKICRFQWWQNHSMDKKKGITDHYQIWENCHYDYILPTIANLNFKDNEIIKSQMAR